MSNVFELIQHRRDPDAKGTIVKREDGTHVLCSEERVSWTQEDLEKILKHIKGLNSPGGT